MRTMRRWWQRPAAPLLVVAAVQLSIHLTLNGVYGFHTDELYYVIAGQHPAPGYVDFPALTPLLAWLNTSIFGIHPWTLRLFPALATATVVFLTGMCAREMGGGRGASLFASVLALICPLLLGTWLFQTVAFDQLTWMISLYLFLRIVTSGNSRFFVPLGIALGVGFETKTTILALCVGIAAATLFSRDLRPMLRTRHLWIGVAIAVVVAVPNIAWQMANGFPTLTYIHNHSGDIAGGGGAVAFVALFILTMGPLLLPLWVAGLVLLMRDPRLRPLGVAVTVAILLLLPEGKGYYPGPTIPAVFAAGSVAVARIVSVGRRRWMVGLALAGGVLEAILLGPIVLPLVPAASLHATKMDALNPDYANTVGWPQMTSQVGAVYNALPPSQRTKTGILTNIDGTAGAIDIYGGSDHLPQAISPHLSFWFWKPDNLDVTTLVTVGYDPSDLAFLCGNIERAGNVTVPYSVANLEQGAPILVCTNLRESLDAAWPRLQNFS